ncbi:hypothetical protein GCM10009795_096740 [Nocardioides hankookensis]|uniref:Uncharacterized protein n=1 Tax=Nocardioides hankookensis TaxID=443157 RepID=A0ABW1LMB1_9ACTN
MTITVTIRPNGARTEVRNLPWDGRPGSGYAIIEDAIDASRRGQVLYSGGAFLVARGHTALLVRRLADRFGHVHVIQHGGTTQCVEACWNASPDTGLTCECSCAGTNHGSGHQLGRIVSESGPAGALSVAPAAAREYDVYRS